MAFTITLATNKKNKNSIARNVTNAICSPVVELKEDTSIIEPTFVLDLSYNGMTSGDIVVNANYLVCTKFNRYYWITNIVFTSMDVVEITCIVDALATFAIGIMESEAYINYASSSYNSMIPDNRIPMSVTHNNGFQEETFDILSSTGCYILFAASEEASGTTGLAQGYACDVSTLRSIAIIFFGSDALSKIIDKLYSPLDSIVSCMWIPLTLSAASGEKGMMKFGDYVVGEHNFAKIMTSTTAHMTVDLPYMDANRNYDWRNCPPYTNWYVWLPGCGLVEFPMELCIKGNNNRKPVISFGLQVSPTNGECSYNIVCNDTLVMFCKGNLGVNLPLSKTNNGMGNLLTSSAGILAGTGLAMASQNPAIAIGGVLTAAASAVSAGASLIQHSVSANGAIGGWATPESLRTCVRLFHCSSALSDNPFGSLKEVIGAPVFKYAKLSSYNGSKVFCSNINYAWNRDIAPTDREYEMIRQAFVSQEGVILKETE